MNFGLRNFSAPARERMAAIAAMAPVFSFRLYNVNDAGAGRFEASATDCLVRSGQDLFALVSLAATAVDVAQVGLNGLDVARTAANDATWHYVHLVSDGRTRHGYIVSLSATAPRLPDGYNYSAFVGALYNTASGSITWRKAEQTDRLVAADKVRLWNNKAGSYAGTNLQFEVLSGADLTTFRTLVPPMARTWRGILGNSVWGVSVELAARADTINATPAYILGAQRFGVYQMQDWAGFIAAVNVELMMTSEWLFYYRMYDPTAAAALDITGFTL